LLADTAFVIGDYEQAAFDTTPAASYKSSQFSDSSLSLAVDFRLGPSVLSSLAGSVNIPTGDTKWEDQSAVGAIPFLFEPSYYHGRGWGGSLFWSVASDAEAFQWSVGTGYLLTTTYNVGLIGETDFNPGDSLLVTAGLGGKASDTENLSASVVHTFPFQSKVTDPLSQFTSAESTVFSGQWLSHMGGDRLALNLSYGFYGRGTVADPSTGAQIREDENFLGDRLEFRPVLAWRAGAGVLMQSGAVWDWIMPNGYPPSDGSYYQDGGYLLGAEQSMTFEMGGGVFLNLAGLYHYIVNQKAAVDVKGNLYDVTYNRISFGTNVGFQW
jgi:hypothetical protein